MILIKSTSINLLATGVLNVTLNGNLKGAPSYKAIFYYHDLLKSTSKSVPPSTVVIG